MKESFDYDVIVIGGGLAGMVSAVTANGLGKQVAVVEKSKVGGNCTNSTCIPSKALIRLSHVSQEMAHFAGMGLFGGPLPELSRRTVMPYIKGIIRKAYEKDRPDTFSEIGIDVIQGSASFMDAHRIQAEGATYSAERFIVAAGTTPFIPPIEGLSGVDFLTNETLYEIDEIPESLIVLGGGVDGLEYASAFASLGVRTTVVEMATRLLPMVDLELVNHLLRLLKQKGIRFLTGTKAVMLSQRPEGVVLAVEAPGGSREEIVADRVIVAVGRKPDLEGLGLEKAGVSVTPRGIVVDETLRTSVPHIYASGDVAGPYQLASTAEAQAIVAATNACLPVKRKVDYSNNVYVIFTDPPLAYLGLTEAQAHEAMGDSIRVYHADYANMRRALVDGRNGGLAKIVCDRRGRILGAHILGEGAPEVIHELQVIRAFKKPLHALNRVTHAYPTYAQALAGRAGQLAFLDRMAGSRAVRLGLRLLPGCSDRLHLARERLAEAGPPAIRTPIGEGAEAHGGEACVIEQRMTGEGSLILDFRGSLNAANEKHLLPACSESFERSKNILLNFSGLVHVDGEGLGLLVVYASLARQRGLGIGATGLADKVRDVFHLTHLDRVIALFDSEKEFMARTGQLKKRRPGRETYSPFDGVTLEGWARSTDRVSLEGIPREAMNLNGHGRRVTSPVSGFGRLWDKKYRLSLHDRDIDPQDVVALWKAEFPAFWPKGNRVFPCRNEPLAPGVTAILNLRLPGGLTLATAILVAYGDRSSFSFMTVEGHMLAGLITFSSFREQEVPVIQVHALFRAGDPLMELAFRLGASSQEDLFWNKTLQNIARRLGSHGSVEQRSTLVDRVMNWSEGGGLWKNAALRSSLYMPVYLLKKMKHARV